MTNEIKTVTVPVKTLESWRAAARNGMSAYLEAVIDEAIADAPKAEQTAEGE